MFCVECGKEIPNGVKFCPECGASQIVKVEEKPAKAKPNKKISTKKETTDYSKMVKADLKQILKSKKLPISGSKQELIERLTDKNWKKKNESKKLKNNKSGKKKNTKAWENFQILILSIPGLLFLFATIVGAYIANSTPLEPIGTINGETVYNGACSSFTYGCIEIAFYGLCVAITNVFFAFALVKKPETSQTIFSVVILVGVLLGLGAVFLGSGIVLQIQTIGICGSVLTIAIVFIAISNNESKIEAAGHAWLMLTVLGAIFAIILYVILF